MESVSVKHIAVRFSYACFILLLGVFLPSEAQNMSWESPPPEVQLQMDPTLVPIGKGAIFVPSMTDPENEPVFGVIRDGRTIQDSQTGHRVPVEPGEYQVIYGSGTKDQMMKKRVKVVEGSTTVVKADWAGLVIEVINESRLEIREYYELFSLDTGESYGLGQGIEEGLDEKLRTWILPPGSYKIVKPGNNINAVINFGTIRLLPGELVHTSLVVDSKTGNFLGYGLLPSVRQGVQGDRKWNTRSELSGNALLNYTPSNVSGLESDTNFTATVQWLTDARYESGRHVIPVWSNIEEGLSLQGTKDLRKYIDRAELRLTYIYRLNDYINPYLRFGIESSFFKTYYRFEDPTDFAEISSKGDTVRVVSGATEVKTAGPFSPILFKEGFGATSNLFRSIPVNFTLRSGYGARQTYARGAYIFNKDTKQLIPINQTSLTGVEMLLLGDIRLGRYIIFTTQFDILMPKTKTSSWVYDGENRLRLNLSSNVSILFTHEYWRDETLKKNQSRYQTLLRFSRFL
jgi:opacity protein-like surface antigen